MARVPYPKDGRRAVPFRPAKAEDIPIDKLLAELGRDIPGTSVYQAQHPGPPGAVAQAAANVQRRVLEDLDHHPPGAQGVGELPPPVMKKAVQPHGMSSFNPPDSGAKAAAKPAMQVRAGQVAAATNSIPSRAYGGCKMIGSFGARLLGQPHSGRRSKIAGAKAQDVDLLTSMANRLNALEKKMNDQRREIAEKDIQIIELKMQVGEQRDDSAEVRRLSDENIWLRKQQLEMEKFLADYGLTWVGDGKRPVGQAKSNSSSPDLQPLEDPSRNQVF
jgi:hypothetical protein